ncbi:hypothetical protein GGI07_000060 [Coemansia sp. Benny D115]|nr:hypothetical protein GGI07_000060 [Coemansia sp. Benny D115]
MSTDTNSANQLADYLGDGQPLADALRSGDRETIEAIVHRLTDQLELLKQESQMAGLPPLPTSSAVLTGTTASSTSNMAKDTSTDHVHMHRRRLSSIPGIASAKSMARSSTDDLRATKDRRKRATMAPGLLGSEAPRVGLFCAYCGMSLDEGFDMATKATLSSEIGYCCSNCESILSSAIEGEDDEGSGLLQAGAAGATTSGGLLLDGDSISINAVVGDASEGTTRSVGTLQRQQVCDVCHGDLGEEYVNVLGRRFHVTHFCCEDCNIPLYALGGYLQDPAAPDDKDVLTEVLVCLSTEVVTVDVS